MTGQDAVNVANTFNEKLEITGVILTKLDGDTRGGAALSVRAVTGKPIKFAGTGEKLTDLEAFHPERMASRILGMGDVMTLIEKAQENIDEEQAKKLEQKMRKNEFDFEMYLDSMSQMKTISSARCSRSRRWVRFPASSRCCRAWAPSAISTFRTTP